MGGWPSGYSSFYLDSSPPYLIKAGADNVIAIRLAGTIRPVHRAGNPGGGIYRNVWLVKTSPVHVGQWGTFVTTPVVMKDAAKVNLKVTVDNDSAADATVKVERRYTRLTRRAKRPGRKGGAG